MSETKHTPGPWKAKYSPQDSVHVIRMGSALDDPHNYESHHVVEYDHCLERRRDKRQFAEADANARLIAAAPDLLETLKRAHACATYDEQAGRCVGCPIQDAIDKAEGR